MANNDVWPPRDAVMVDVDGAGVPAITPFRSPQSSFDRAIHEGYIPEWAKNVIGGGESVLEGASSPETTTTNEPTFFALSSPEIVQSDVPQFFPPNQGTVRNSDSVVFSRYENTDLPWVAPKDSEMSTGRPISNGEVSMAPERGAPVSNSDTAVVNGGMSLASDLGSRGSDPGLGRPISNSETSMAPALTPVQNSDVSVMLSQPEGDAGRVDFGSTITNERQHFFPQTMSSPLSNDLNAAVIFGDGVVVDDGDSGEGHRRVGLRSERAEVDLVRSVPPVARGVVNVDQGAVSFFMAGAAISTGDVTMGGGGDLSKQPRESEYSFGGQNTMSIGGTEVQQTLSGDSPKTPGQDDVTMALNADSMSNPDHRPTFVTGSQGEPTNNADFNDHKEGAVGKPLKKNVS